MSSVASPAPMRRSFMRALGAVLCTGLLLVMLLVALLPLSGPLGAVLVLFPLNALVFLGAGLLAWYHRPSSRMGGLILLTGVWVWLGGAANTDVVILMWCGTVAGSLALAGMVHLLLAFPTGDVGGRVARGVVWTAYGTSLLLEAPGYLFGEGSGLPGLPWVDAPEVAWWGGVLQEGAGCVVLMVTLVLLALRLRAATLAERRSLVPLYAYGLFAVAVLLLAARVLRPLQGWDPLHIATLQLLVICGVPVVFALGTLRGGIARTGAVEELGVWLGEVADDKLAIRAALARALGDPSLQVWFWASDRQRYIDAEGRDVGNELDLIHRAVTPIELEGRRIGAISCDTALMAETDLVDAAGRVVAIALDRERLVVELLASQRALRASRERLVEVADRERRRIAQDLHDGLQVQLVLLALEAQQITSHGDDRETVRARATELRIGIDAAAAELREVVHAVMPAALAQRGLSAAVEDLVDRLPVAAQLTMQLVDQECSPVVESTAYFVVAEALANTVKHGHAHAIDVSVGRDGDMLRVEVRDDGDGGAELGGGLGLTGIVERVEALGGVVRIETAPDEGTLIRAEIPCV